METKDTLKASIREEFEKKFSEEIYTDIFKPPTKEQYEWLDTIIDKAFEAGKVEGVDEGYEACLEDSDQRGFDTFKEIEKAKKEIQKSTAEEIIKDIEDDIDPNLGMTTAVERVVKKIKEKYLK